MAILNIRNLPDEVHARLRVRAAKAGRSMEAEAREILAHACPAEAEPYDPERLKAFMLQEFGGALPTGQVDALIAERRAEAIKE